MENDIVGAIETAASTNNEGKEDVTITVELVYEEERLEDGERVEWNGTTISDNLINTSTGRTTKPTMEKDVVEVIDFATPTNNKGNQDLCVAVQLDDT